jgi:hypothetical protein
MKTSSVRPRPSKPHHSKELQYDEYDGDDDQNVDPIANAREAWTDVPTEKAEQPQYDENHDDSPQHERPPSK